MHAAAFQTQDREWREPAQVLSNWAAAASVDTRLLTYRASKHWWDLLEGLNIVLLVTREYEHLLMAMSSTRNKPKLSHLPLPHPSGVVADRTNRTVYVASTRNPNQVFEFGVPNNASTLLPTRSWFLPGRLYIHELALIDGELYANAVGENAVIGLPANGGYVRKWWPRVIETAGGPTFDKNYLQLNSIAAGCDLASSFFSASASTLSRRRPGHQNFAVDRRGVIFSGQSREPVVHGLTRPHSARLHAGRLWVDNSGYGELAVVCGGKAEALARLPGWTRGLLFYDDVAFVGTSRVLPRFRQYAPGLDSEKSECAIHAIEWKTGRTLASLHWPHGNQIFGIEWMPGDVTTGLPFTGTGTSKNNVIHSFYTYEAEA